MAQANQKLPVSLEVGQKRVLANALEWPGWARNGKGEEAALQALLNYAPRYANVLKNTGLGYEQPEAVSAFEIVERLVGDATTDFGGMGMIASYDEQPMGDAELARSTSILQACWGAFNQARHAAIGKELRKGPRGGGRDLNGVIEHILGATTGYLARIQGKFKHDNTIASEVELVRAQQAALEALTSAVHNGLSEQGPRGGKIWRPRHFVRILAWHLLDHAWEIEDRIM